MSVTDGSAEPDSSRELRLVATFFFFLFFIIKGTIQKKPRGRDV